MAGRLSNLNRVRQIVQTFARHGLGGLVDQLGLADSSLLPAAAKDKMAARFGRRLTMALNDLGPTFVKFGQILATREDVVPAAMSKELAQLCDSSQPLPGRVIRRHVEEALKAPITELFDAFSDEPLATGSIAQVHTAHTWQGQEVVVKVRRPKIESVIERDLEVLRSTAEMAAARMPELARHDPIGFVDEFGRSLQEELDFTLEANALQRMNALLGNTAKVPRTFPESSCESILTQEYLRGVQVGKIGRPDLRAQTALKLVGAFATQYMRGDLFHADPHAGNVLLLDSGQLGLLDFGSVGSVTSDVRGALFRAANYAARRDARGVAVELLAMVHVPDDLNREVYFEQMAGAIDSILTQPIGSVSAGEVMQQLFAVTRHHSLRLRSEYFLLFRSIMLLDGVMRSLNPELDPIAATRSYILRSLFTRAWFLMAVRLVVGTVRRRCRRAAVALVAVFRSPRAENEDTKQRRRFVASIRARAAKARGWARGRVERRHRRQKEARQWNQRRRIAIGLVVTLGVLAVFVGGWLLGRARPVSSDALDETAANEEQPAETALAARPCRVRTRPDLKAKTSGRIQTGDRVEVLGTTRYYWKIRTLEGLSGYALKGCLNPSQSAGVPSAPGPGS